MMTDMLPDVFDDQEAPEVCIEDKYRGVSYAWNTLVKERLRPQKTYKRHPLDPRTTQKRWNEILANVKRRLAEEENEEDDDDESGGEYFQMTQGGGHIVAKGAVKGTIEAIVSTAKGAEKSKRRARNRESNTNNSSPLTAAEDIVKGIDEISDRQWHCSDGFPERERQQYTPNVMFEKQRQIYKQGDGSISGILATEPEKNVILQPEHDILPSDSLSTTTRSPSPAVQTILSSSTSHVTNTTSRPQTPKKSLVPYVVIYTNPKLRSSTASTCITKPKHRRKNAPTLRSRVVQAACDIFFFLPTRQFTSYSSAYQLIYKPRLTIDRLAMLCTRARVRSKSRKEQKPKSPCNGSVSDSGQSTRSGSGFLKRNLKSTRLRHGSFKGRWR